MTHSTRVFITLPLNTLPARPLTALTRKSSLLSLTTEAGGVGDCGCQPGSYWAGKEGREIPSKRLPMGETNDTK